MNFIAEHFSSITDRLTNLLDSTKPIVFFETGNFRISSVVTTTWLVMLIIIVFVLVITSKLDKESTTRRQAIAEKITLGMHNFIAGSLGEAARKVYGIIGSIFIIILVMNFMWVIPTFTNPTASYSTTLALALIGYLYTQSYIIKVNSLKSYIKSYVEPTPIMIVGNVVEIFSKPLSLSMRLFGNMFASKILDTLAMIILPLLLPIAFSLLSILSGVIQAYVFALLLTMYIEQSLSE